MQLAEKEFCTGCGACIKICPQKAITFKDDKEGFPTPVIQENLCIECGLCNKTCPAIRMPETNSIQVAYAAQIKDRVALLESTSGGLFTAFARDIFKRGGLVYGCIWDEHYNAIIKKAENEEEIIPMRGSKYVWSWAGGVFPEIKEFLEKGRIVMFTGLPCQIAGLRKYLRKEYEQLILVDFFCGGAPSPYAFKKYLETLTKSVNLEELNLKFRDKKIHGVGVHITYAINRGRVYQNYVRNPYFFSYHTKVFHRLSCYQCQYRYEKRVSDITFGDYWGVKEFHPELDIRAGVSAVLVNTEKGEKLLNRISEDIILVPTKVENIAKGNNLTLGERKVTFTIPEFRERFFSTLNKKGWRAAEHKYLYNKRRLKLWIKTKLPYKYLVTLRNYLNMHL